MPALIFINPSLCSTIKTLLFELITELDSLRTNSIKLADLSNFFDSSIAWLDGVTVSRLIYLFSDLETIFWAMTKIVPSKTLVLVSVIDLNIF